MPSSSNSGTIAPAEVVEIAALPSAGFVLGVLVRERREVGARLTFASTSSACFRTAASSLPSVFSRMWLARTCSGVENWSMWSL